MLDALADDGVQPLAGGGTEGAAFDGIVCIGGEDWWYHNRGHFDFQIMRRLARRYPVLFVNSIGVRMPSLGEGTQFARRIARKVQSLSRGLVEAEPGFFVFSPVTAPGRVGSAVSGFALAPQVRLAARRAGIRRPVLWVHCPAGARLADEIPAAAIVMQRTDRFEAFPDADPSVVTAQIAHLKSRADLAVYAAAHLMGEEAGQVRSQLLVTHGVDLDRFALAGRSPGADPVDLAAIPRPRIGFIGGIDHHTFDPSLLIETARGMPDAEFVLVGGCSLPQGWCPLPNVHLLGRKPYEHVAAYMAGMDVLIMPWNDSPWIKACNPIKLKEYLATGRPIVTTDFPALDDWRHLVHVAAGPEAFEQALRAVLADPGDAEARRMAVSSETWDAKADRVACALIAAVAARRKGRKACTTGLTD